MVTKQAKVEIVTTLREDGFRLDLKYTNGQTRTYQVDAENELFVQFAAKGAKDKLLSAANSVGDADVAVQKVDALIDAFDEGKWSLKGEGDGKYSPLMHALAELKGIELEAAETLVKAMSKSTQAKLRATERVRVIIDRIKASKGEADGDSVLDDILKEDDGEDSESAAERAA